VLDIAPISSPPTDISLLQLHLLRLHGLDIEYFDGLLGYGIYTCILVGYTPPGKNPLHLAVAMSLSKISTTFPFTLSLLPMLSTSAGNWVYYPIPHNIHL
jgi:hypothetical protein